MKRIIFFVMIFVPSFVGAYDAQIDGIYYNFNDSTAVVTCQYGYPGEYCSSDYAGDVRVPEWVEDNGVKYHVTSVDGSAFCYY